MHQLPLLKPGDSVEIIAPASRCSDKHLAGLKALLSSWQLNCIVADTIFGDDLLCANTDEIRFQSLKNALLNPKTKAVICARGGYGSMRLIPELAKVTPPNSPKLFIGMSDITALHLFLQQKWQWPVLHGAIALDKFSPESIASVKSILFNEIQPIEFSGLPLNSAAEKNKIIESTIIGGNLCLIQTSIGTIWQINGKNKIILLEEVGERGYRIDRMLEHLRQAGIFNDAAAILLGDFISGTEPNGTSLIKPVLERFAKTCEIPIVQIAGIGHDYINYPILLGTKSQLTLGNKIHLICHK
jgi:muramoyltetrapeptide carboxypeptidase